MFRRRPARDDADAPPTMREVDGVSVIVTAHDMRRTHDIVLVRRIRGLELTDDRWQFSFRPEGQIEVVGKAGAQLARRVGRVRPDLTVQVHFPDDD